MRNIRQIHHLFLLQKTLIAKIVFFHCFSTQPQVNNSFKTLLRFAVSRNCFIFGKRKVGVEQTYQVFCHFLLLRVVRPRPEAQPQMWICKNIVFCNSLFARQHQNPPSAVEFNENELGKKIFSWVPRVISQKKIIKLGVAVFLNQNFRYNFQNTLVAVERKEKVGLKTVVWKVFQR